MYGGDHGHSGFEDGLVSVDPLEAGQGRIRGDLGVRVGRMVSRHTQVEVPQLYLSHLEHWDPLGWEEMGERWKKKRPVVQ